jgi:hypothetical protein
MGRELLSPLGVLKPEVVERLLRFTSTPRIWSSRPSRLAAIRRIDYAFPLSFKNRARAPRLIVNQSAEAPAGRQR